VIACLAQALGNTLALPTTGGENEKGRVIEKTAVEILRHYERMNRAVGKDRDAAVKLLRVREALNAKNAGRPDVALEVRVLLFELCHPFRADGGRSSLRSWSQRISFLWMVTLRK
jgi:hypothetical protein